MDSKICIVCKNENSKYKCPKCLQTYCSMACCKEHKRVCSGKTKTPNENDDFAETSSEYRFPTEDTVPIQKLEELRKSKKVINNLKDPQLRDIITSILKDNNPTKALGNAMMNPMFVDFANACLEVTEPPDENKPC